MVDVTTDDRPGALGMPAGYALRQLSSTKKVCVPFNYPLREATQRHGWRIPNQHRWIRAVSLAVVRSLAARFDMAWLLRTSLNHRRRRSPLLASADNKHAERGRVQSAGYGPRCTSHVERDTLTLRTFIKRMARLSCAFSKKWANHEAMIGLAIAHSNFCRVHGKLKTTPAVASGIENHKWTVRQLIERTAAS